MRLAHAAQADEADFDAASVRGQGFAVAVQPGLVRRWRARFRDGQFEGEAVLLQQASAVFAARRLFGAVGFAFVAMLIAGMVVGPTAAGSQQ
ncbi:hypothetical protein D9M69_705250 [compost metagenome]